jgi:hypothetical protein
VRMVKKCEANAGYVLSPPAVETDFGPPWARLIIYFVQCSGRGQFSNVLIFVSHVARSCIIILASCRRLN